MRFCRLSLRREGVPSRLLGAFQCVKAVKWKSQFLFIPIGIVEITSRGGPLISLGIFRPKFSVPFLTNGFFALTKE